MDIKQTLDTISIPTAIASFFEVIPWPEIAGFLSTIWITVMLFEYFKGKIKKWLNKN